MSVQQPDIQWYIARDGKQHGPLSDMEMRTFVAQGHLRPTDLIWRPGFSDWRPAPAVFQFSTPETPRPATAPAERSFEPSRIRTAQETGTGSAPPVRRAIAAAAVLALLGGGGWYVWHNDVGGLRGGADQPTEVVKADQGGPPKGGAAPIVTAALSPEAIEQGAQALDAKFQQTAMWSVVKREFPDWYGERLREVAKLTAEKQPQAAINKHLAQALVELRRKHAKEALSASTDKLKLVANAFLDNLKRLQELGIGACYGFISQGETAPVVLELLQSPDAGASIHAQVAAIFEAIADGRRAPTTHERAAKADYEVLVQQLTKLGWKENDLKVFSDPAALSREPPARVCQMVQDWFTAHLAVEDKATQERLLVETLKPVVSG